MRHSSVERSLREIVASFRAKIDRVRFATPWPRCPFERRCKIFPRRIRFFSRGERRRGQPTRSALETVKGTEKTSKRLRCRYLRRPARKIELLDVFSNASRNLKRLSRQLFRPCCLMRQPSLCAVLLVLRRLKAHLFLHQSLGNKRERSLRTPLAIV